MFVFTFRLYPLELRLHFDSSYVVGEDVFVDVYSKIDLYGIVKNYVDNGAILFLNYRVDLLKENYLLFDTMVENKLLYRKIYFDFFTGEYVVLSSETMKETRSVYLETLLREVQNITRVFITKEDSLDDSGQYYYRTRLTIQLQHAYPYLGIFFNLITPLTYRIKWLKSDSFRRDDLLHKE